MQARRTLPLGQKGTKKFLELYGRQLICACIRYDEQRRRRGDTVEIVIEESGWSPPEKPEIVELRIEFQENELKRRIEQAGDR
jgi:hypothetical protein